LTEQWNIRGAGGKHVDSGYEEFAIIYLFFIIILSGVRLSPLGTVATTDLSYQPQMIDEMLVIVEQLVE
jgi:hypothetical protein